MNWTVQKERLERDGSSGLIPRDRALRLSFAANESTLFYQDILSLWQTNESFRQWFTDTILAVPFRVFRWETPPVTKSTLNQPFECVVIADHSLDRNPDRATFASYFTETGNGIVEFTNIGKDALLIVPCPPQANANYAHLAAFLRQAPRDQQQALWQTVGNALQRRLSERPVWLSTAGGGVAWLHVRLDDRPKYYRYAPYRVAP